MPVAANTSEALVHHVRAFLRHPTHEGLFVHCRAEGVDLVVQVHGEAPAAATGACDACGHVSRFERAPSAGEESARCSLCHEPLEALVPAAASVKYCAFSWRAAWARDGVEGLGMGTTIDEGSFVDGEILTGIADMHACLRLFLPLFEAVNVTTMKDYRALTKLGAPFKAEVQLAES